MRLSATALIAGTVLTILGTIPVSAQEAVPVFFGGQSNYDNAPNVPFIFMFESLEADTAFWGSYGSTPEDPEDRDYFLWSNWDGPAQQGEGSLFLDWGLFSDNDWGGSSALQHYLPDSVDGEPNEQLYDFSDFTHINIWTNTLVPGDPAATWRLKMHDASEGLGNAPSSVTEDWYSEWSNIYQNQPGWYHVSIPLESLGNVSPGTGGFSRPGCPASCWSGIYGNGELDLDKISGFQLELTGPQFGAVADSSSAGTIVYDNFYVSGVRYNVVHAFDQVDDLGHWDNGSGSHTLTVVDDTVQGSGAAELDYNLIADLSWGGSVDIDYNPGSLLDNMSERTALSLFYKVIEPASVPGQVSLTFKLFDSSTGVREEWQYNAGAIYDDTTGTWRRLLVPLRMASGGQDGFAIPSWITDRGDETLNLNQLDGFQLQMAGVAGTTTSGKIIFDRLTGYGMQQVDFEAPAAVEGLAAEPLENANSISWEDVPEEDGETYTLYASESPIDDVEAEGVMVLERSIVEGTEVYVHQIFSPKVDQEVSYYYAITATDPFGNTSEVSTLESAVTNTAKGIPTISLSPPDFTADGDLSEWMGIEPIHIEPGGEIGHVADGYTITDANDMSADVRMAIDNEAIYFAADVTDDSYNPVPAGHETNRWTFDVIELYFGFYDGRREEHASYGTEDDIDLQINLYGENILASNNTISTEGDGGHMFSATDKGWSVEAKIPFEGLGVTFEPKNGMRVPLDIVLMDNDLGGQDNREGLLAYSFWNNDDSYLSPLNWWYNWIGDKASVGVERLDVDVPDRFALEQNYPNPFNPSTVIQYALPSEGRVLLKVYNTIGQEVMTLVDREQTAGVYEVRFDASGLASGLYLYQLQAGNQIMTKSMLLLR